MTGTGKVSAAVASGVTDLIAYLNARLDEDTAEAWDRHEGHCATAGPISFPCDCGYPARVLREVEAVRAVMAIHEAAPSMYGEPPVCMACWPQPRIGTHPLWPCSTLRALAGIWEEP